MLQIDWVAKIDIANETPGGAVPSNFARERENPARTPMHMKAKVYTKAYKRILKQFGTPFRSKEPPTRVSKILRLFGGGATSNASVVLEVELSATPSLDARVARPLVWVSNDVTLPNLFIAQNESASEQQSTKDEPASERRGHFTTTLCNASQHVKQSLTRCHWTRGK
jgi:hypothetical protein